MTVMLCAFCDTEIPDGKACDCRGARQHQKCTAALRTHVAELERAFDDQARELENALSFLSSEQMAEFRRKTYPSLHPAQEARIHPTRKPQPNGFDLATFAPSLDGDAGESLGSYLQKFEGAMTDYDRDLIGNVIRAKRDETLDELRRAACAIGIVGEKDGHDLIRRESVLDLIDQRRLNP